MIALAGYEENEYLPPRNKRGIQGFCGSRTLAYQAKVLKLEERPTDATHTDRWTHPDRSLRLQVVNDAGTRWIYCNRVDNLGGMGPTNYGPARAIIGEPGASPAARQQRFEQMRTAGVLVGGDDPDISRRFHPGDRVLV